MSKCQKGTFKQNISVQTFYAVTTTQVAATPMQSPKSMCALRVSFVRSSAVRQRKLSPMQAFRESVSSILQQALQQCQSEGSIPQLPGSDDGLNSKSLPNVSIESLKNRDRGDFFSAVLHQLSSTIKKFEQHHRLDSLRKFDSMNSSTYDTVNVAATPAASSGSTSFSSSIANSGNVQLWAETLIRKATPLLNATEDLRDRIDLIANNGFINMRVRDPDWLSSFQPKSSSSSSKHAPPPQFNMQAIGSIESCFPEKHGTPRQGSKAPTTRARLTLHADLSQHLLDGLSGYSHVWLVFVFHANSEQASELGAHGKSKIRAPRLMGDKIGMFASRTPHRVNPIGLTVCKLDKVEGGTIHLSGVDVIDGTPVLDIKPYHIADSVPADQLILPGWVNDFVNVPLLNVEFTAAADQQLASIVGDAKTPLDFYGPGELSQIRRAIIDCLALDPRSVHSKTKHQSGIYCLSFDRLDIVFRMLSATDAQVWRLIYHPPDLPRPRTRTRSWLQHTQAELNRLISSGELQPGPESNHSQASSPASTSSTRIESESDEKSDGSDFESAADEMDERSSSQKQL